MPRDSVRPAVGSTERPDPHDEPATPAELRIGRHLDRSSLVSQPVVHPPRAQPPQVVRRSLPAQDGQHPQLVGPSVGRRVGQQLGSLVLDGDQSTGERRHGLGQPVQVSLAAERLVLTTRGGRLGRPLQQTPYGAQHQVDPGLGMDPDQRDAGPRGDLVQLDRADLGCDDADAAARSTLRLPSEPGRQLAAPSRRSRRTAPPAPDRPHRRGPRGRAAPAGRPTPPGRRDPQVQLPPWPLLTRDPAPALPATPRRLSSARPSVRSSAAARPLSDRTTIRCRVLSD